MRIGQILQKIGDGLTKDHVYYWEKVGYLRPQLIKKAKIERKEYSENDLKMIENIWKYYKEGFPPKIAFEKATKELEQSKRFEKKTLSDLLLVENESLHNSIDRVHRLWGRNNVTTVLMSPLNKEIKETAIFKEIRRLLDSTHLGFDAELLYELSSRIISIIKKDRLMLDGIIATSPATSMISSAASVLAFREFSLNLNPYLLAIDEKGKPKLIGGKLRSGSNVAVIIEKLVSFDELIDLMARVMVFNLKASKIIGVLDFLSDEDKDKISRERYEVSYILKKADLVNLLSGNE